jgi:hypothetical protein
MKIVPLSIENVQWFDNEFPKTAIVKEDDC